MIQAKNLHKYYDQLHVLKELIYTFKRRNCLHRGCLRAGKTTLLQILGTLDKPTVESGIELRINEDILTMNDKTLSKFRNLNLGFIFQFHQLLPDLPLSKTCVSRFYCKQI
jgi:lipoprotein-releasing system ATP-binding protein